MKHPISSGFGLAVMAGVSLVTSASAVVSIDYVSVGNAGNANDSTGYGGVAYNYKIAKNETTIGQYAEFLNAAAKTDTYALYNPSMTTSYINGISRSGVSGGYTYAVNPGSANKPITYVSWFDAARMCNWMQNGQGSGSTETGAYTLNGAVSGIYTKNAGATVWIPSENEWYKAAYYDPNKGGAGVGGYWLQATQSNTLPGNTVGIANSANYFDGDWVGYPGASLTDVGSYGLNSESAYRTNDQAGNVLEWNDAVISGTLRGMRGGSWGGGGDPGSSTRGQYTPSAEGGWGLGFRVASVPEPSCLVLTLLASGMFVTRRKR